MMSIYYPLDPCFTTNTIDEWKRSVANPDYNDICDNLLIPGWYRIISGAGEKMPTTCGMTVVSSLLHRLFRHLYDINKII
jgi:hypothetical protein